MNLSRPLSSLIPTLEGEVLTVLAGAQASFTGDQVHAIIGKFSDRGVRNALQRLSTQGIVTRTRAGAADLYELSPEHLMAKYIKSIAGLRKELLSSIKEEVSGWELAPVCAALFGSAVRADMRADSDIDIFLVRPASIEMGFDPWEEQSATLTSKVSKWTGNDARVFELSETEVEEGVILNEGTIVNIINEGVIFFGDDGYLRSLRYKKSSKSHG